MWRYGLTTCGRELSRAHVIVRNNHLHSRHGYADDSQLYTRLYMKYPEQVQAAVHRMEQCLIDVKSWMVNNRLKLNDSKTEVLVVVRKQQRQHVQNIKVKVGDSEIVPSKCVRNLGGVLDEDLTMAYQVKSVVKGMNFHIKRLGKVRQYLDKETCARVIHATVTSRPDYHNALLTGIHEKHLRHLQVTQNNAARLLTRSGRRDHMTPVLQQLHWLPVTKGVDFKVLTLIYKALHEENCPDYLRTMFPLYTPTRNLRSSNDRCRIDVPTTKNYYGDRSVTVHGGNIWNKLPLDIRTCASLQSLKKLLKTVLFRQAYGL